MIIVLGTYLMISLGLQSNKINGASLHSSHASATKGGKSMHDDDWDLDFDASSSVSLQFRWILYLLCN